MSHASDVFRPLGADDPPVVGGYRLAARLGAGGMGRVYLSHTHGGRPVAIKVVRPELADDQTFRRRFSREITAARRVRGAYTAELIDADADGTPPWLATLYVPGPSLTESVSRRGPLPVPALLWLMAGVAEALQAIHSEGIVHRDLKPSNVLLAADGPRVIDFGIALAADGTAYTATGNAIGTPAYMSPEQASGEEVTAAADIFALGQTAAYAALGRPLYGEGPGVNVLYRIVHSEPDLSLLPEPLRPLFARCLAADPAERATPSEVVEWCRERLGADADAGAGPTVWQEIAGPHAAVPPPVTAPAPAHPQRPTANAQAPADRLPPTEWQRPGAWQQPLTGVAVPTRPGRTSRRGRNALITAGGVLGGALLVAALSWSVLDALGRAGLRDTAGPSTSATEPAARSSASATGAASGPSGGAALSTDGRDTGTSPSSPHRREAPLPATYPAVWLDAKHPVSLKNPSAEWDKGATGEIRFSCASAGCDLESSTDVFTELSGKQGGSLDGCRATLAHGTHTLPLASTGDGSRICIKGATGDVALLVVGTKSTAMPDIGFVSGEMSIWRGAA